MRQLPEGTPLADVFIAYSRIDRDRVRPIAERLGSLGYSVWVSDAQRISQAALVEMDQNLDASLAVLAIWSQHARSSSLVYALASRALEQGKLLQLKLDESTPAFPYSTLPCADMSGGRSEWGALEDQLARLARGGGAAPAVAVGAHPGLLASPPAAGAPVRLTTAATLTLGAYAGAVSAAYNGLMSPEQLRLALMAMVGVGGVCALLALQRLLAVSRAGG